MTEMTSKEIAEDLKFASMLEASVYRQEEVICVAERQLVLAEPKVQIICAPKNEAESLLKPTEPVLKGTKDPTNYLLSGGLASILGLAIYKEELLILGVMFLVFGVVMFVEGIKLKKAYATNDAESQEKYKKELSDYNENYVRLQEAHKKNMEYYYEQKELADAKYQNELAIAKNNLQNAQNAVETLNVPLRETKEALEKLYSNDIIFPKYRDMVAMSTMYEYFASGRCTELTGPNGAYNLYESELRQNLIINRLDIIISQLEKIKQNQYMLYQEMKETNRVLDEISGDVNQIVKNTTKIATASQFTAYCSEVIVKNTEAIKYITLING